MNFGWFILLQLLVSGLLVLFQLATIPVFLVYRDLRCRILYRIMLSIALSDFLQLFTIFQFTFYEFIGWQMDGTMTEKFSSGIFIIAWDHLIIQHFLLAVNRFLIIFRAYYSPTSYKNKKESRMENGIFNFLVLFSWLVFAGFQVIFMSQLCGGIWDREAVGFFYDLRLECSQIYRDYELYFTIAFPALSSICYVAIIVILKKTRNIKIENPLHQKSHPKQLNATSSLNGVLNRKEKQILLLSAVLFSIITVLIFAWYIDYRHPPWTMLFCGYLFINSSLSLIINSEYRHRFLHMWRTILHPMLPCLISRKSQKSKKDEVMIIAANGHQQRNGALTNVSSNSSALFIRRTKENVSRNFPNSDLPKY